MKFGVRVDQEGSLLRDFHTVNGDYAYVTTRYYLEDAIFVVGLESENEELLKQIDDALHHPTFIPFLGRRSCPPSAQIPMGILDAPLEDALRLVPWQMSLWRQRKTGIAYLRLVTDASPDEAGAADVNDVPLSYNPERRKYGWRKVVSREPVKVSPPEIHPAHNAFADL
jgi:CRISPR system Cascade subunit CasD